MNPYSTQFIEDDDIKAVLDALHGDYLTQGRLVREFEEKITEYLGVKHALVFNSATSALYAAYKAIDLNENSEAITSPISFVATANMLLECGCKPVFCDIKQNGNLNEKLIESLITTKTKAVVSVDYAGNSVENFEIQEICKKYNLIFISDSSHAFGAEYHGSKVGTFADASIFSFHAIKPITTAEGGVLVTNSTKIFEQSKLIRSHGVLKKKLWNTDVVCGGFNFRMTEIQAALGISQLKKIERFLGIREEIACFYDKMFEGNPYFFTLHKNLIHKTTNHLYPLIVTPFFWRKKEDIFEALQKNGLGVQVHYKPINEFSLYKQLFGEFNLTNASDFYRAEISIPCHQKMTLKDARVVSEKILKIFENFKIH